jgi:anion-transporting  ArsA/GET3 family ATPase
VIAGKGGVGKSTVAAAIALGAAAEGRRTLVVELSGRSDVARLLGGRPREALTETQLDHGLSHLTIEREAVLQDYLENEIAGPFPAGRLARSRTFSMFVDATPGMGELLSIGKVWELSQRPRRRQGAQTYDLVVLDGPSSGQLIALLRAPRTFGAIARMGPVARQTAQIDRFLQDPRLTGVITVTTPEQMAVTEALTLHDGLATLKVTHDATVVNRTLSFRFSRAEATALRAAPDDPAVSSALWLAERGRAQRRQLDRLRRELPGVARARLPFVFEGLDRAGTQRLADRLGDL